MEQQLWGSLPVALEISAYSCGSADGLLALLLLWSSAALAIEVFWALSVSVARLYEGRLARKGAKSDETPTHQSGTRESYTSADFVTRSSGCGRAYLGNTITMLRKMNCYPMLPGECGNENGQPRSRIGLIAWQREEFYVFARGPTDLALPVHLHRPTGCSAAAGTTKRTQFRCKLLDPDR